MNPVAYIGHPYQLSGTRAYRLEGGMRDGCRCIDVRTGGGLEYTVVCDRAMDISQASFRGINLVYLTPNAEAHPAFYNPAGEEWLRTFTGGLLTTCGPAYLGPPCEDEGESLGLHGRFSALPAQRICDLTDDAQIKLTGQLCDASPFGNKLHIQRSIVSAAGSAALTIRDEVCNKGDVPAPLCMLYHVNFGYPLLCEDARIFVPSCACAGYDEYSQQRMDERFSPKPPSPDNAERNYLHTFPAGQREARVWVWNPKLLDGLAVCLRFSPEQLPYLTQWMLERTGDYVAALEPANVPCESRNVLRARGQLPMLMPGEARSFEIEIKAVSGNKRIEQLIQESNITG